MTSPKEQLILPPEAMQHYDQINEAERLEKVSSQLERVRTQELLERFLPSPPAVVLDIGGAAGIYSFWLARKGYEVHLIDAVPRHIEQAKEAAKGQPRHPLASITIGDARELKYPTAAADAVLLFGPLYHLTKREDRLQALHEAYRVLRPGGVLLAVGISRFISTIHCLTEGLIENEAFMTIAERDLQDGQHRNPTGDPRFFTTGFFHHPDELKGEVETAAFRLKGLLAVEGPARLLPKFSVYWQQEDKREWLLKIVRMVEEDPFLLGISTHVMAVAVT